MAIKFLQSVEIDGELEATTLDINGNADIFGNITSAGWTGDVIASVYLDADTAHLSTTQTFTGAKTFTGTVALTGTGRITGVDTVSSGTDAANKTYVDSKSQSFIMACSDETTALTTGTAKVTFRMPYAFVITDIRASVTTAPENEESPLTIDINSGGTTILDTKLTIDSTEKTSTTAATAFALSDSTLANDAEITIDIDSVGDVTAGAGLKVTLIGYQS
jgi:hypothetical protein